jgi:hypothetical protein
MPDLAGVLCGKCQASIPAGDAHIITSPLGAAHHNLYHTTCCPADHTRPGHLLTALAAEDKAAGRKKRRRRAA